MWRMKFYLCNDYQSSPFNSDCGFCVFQSTFGFVVFYRMLIKLAIFDSPKIWVIILEFYITCRVKEIKSAIVSYLRIILRFRLQIKYL